MTNSHERGRVTAHIWSDGNTVKGIEAREITIPTGLTAFSDEAHRKAVRRQLETCFTQIWADGAKVLFTDELPSD